MWSALDIREILIYHSDVELELLYDVWIHPRCDLQYMSYKYKCDRCHNIVGVQVFRIDNILRDLGDCKQNPWPYKLSIYSQRKI